MHGNTLRLPEAQIPECSNSYVEVEASASPTNPVPKKGSVIASSRPLIINNLAKLIPIGGNLLRHQTESDGGHVVRPARPASSVEDRLGHFRKVL
jgi:hypothetical protein